METSAFLLFALGMLAGLWLLQRRYKRTAALFLGLSIAGFLAILPWRTAGWLMRDNRDFRAWAGPRMTLIRGIWLLASAGFGTTVGLCVVLLEPKLMLRKPEWDPPKNAGNMEGLLREALAGVGLEGTLLGSANGRRPILLKDKCRESHMQIVGPTRSGKSQLLFALSAQDMSRGLPVFFMEAKGDRSDFDQFLKLAEWTGRTCDVRYFNPQDNRSMTFNPVRRLPGQDTTAVANQIARAIGREPTSSGEGQDYYRSVDYAKLLNMAEVFCSTGLEFTLKDCFHYFDSVPAREKAFKLCPDQRLAEIAKQGLACSPDNTALVCAFRPWTTGILGRLLNDYSPAIRLDEVFDGGQLAYFAVPIGHLQVLANPLGRMIISGLLSVAAWRQKSEPKPGPASVILDEFAEFATPVFASFIATVGSARFWTVLSHQDLGQLKKIAGMDEDAFESAVFNNTSGCKVCFRAPDPDDAEFWASTLGTYRTSDDTERVQRGFLGTKATGDMSRRLVEQFKVHPNLLKNLAPGTALVFSPGELECLAKTASVYGLLEDRESPLLAREPRAEGRGLDLESALRGLKVEERHTVKGDCKS